VTSPVAVFEAAIRVKSMYMIKSWLKKYGNQIIFTQIMRISLCLCDEIEIDIIETSEWSR